MGLLVTTYYHKMEFNHTVLFTKSMVKVVGYWVGCGGKGGGAKTTPYSTKSNFIRYLFRTFILLNIKQSNKWVFVLLSS